MSDVPSHIRASRRSQTRSGYLRLDAPSDTSSPSCGFRCWVPARARRGADTGRLPSGASS